MDKVKAKIVDLVPDLLVANTFKIKDDRVFGTLKPITLAVVLRALKKAGKVGRIDTSNFYSDDAEWVMKLIIYWNLEHDNYDAQSQETKDFIGSLLGVN